MTPGCTGKHWYTSAVQAWRVIRHNRIWRGRRKVRVLGGLSVRGVRALAHWKEFQELGRLDEIQG
jgi:hypothetical protein